MPMLCTAGGGRKASQKNDCGGFTCWLDFGRVHFAANHWAEGHLWAKLRANGKGKRSLQSRTQTHVHVNYSAKAIRECREKGLLPTRETQADRHKHSARRHTDTDTDTHTHTHTHTHTKKGMN